MSEKIVVPVLGESITEATVAKWLKNVGETIEADEPIVELETDKVNLEVPSPISGILSEIKKLSVSTTQDQILKLISNYNQDKAIDGILVQLPLPRHLNSEKIIDAISFEKDVDGIAD